MYSTCLFCNDSLGKNEAIEPFPVGRRLAYDGEKGRLWVVCRKCGRWNLTPLEERWEAIEECERAFRGTKLRVSTDQIGLARLSEGLELVRIGSPMRPELAAWRYGDQFGKRRRRHRILIAGGAAATGALVIGGPAYGVIGFTASLQMLQWLHTGYNVYRTRRPVYVPVTGRPAIPVTLAQVRLTKLYRHHEEIVLRISELGPRDNKSVFRVPRDVELTGADAIRAAGILLSRMNTDGGSPREISDALAYLEASDDPSRLFRRAADVLKEKKSRSIFINAESNVLVNLPRASRLALEMATHEDAERRALDGELHVLEEAWRRAEEIAAIADDMFVPTAVTEQLERLKGGR